MFQKIAAAIVQGLAHIYDNLTSDVLHAMVHYEKFQEQLRPVLDLLGTEMYRDRLVATCCKGTVFETLMKSWPAGHFIAWRWNSLADCVSALLMRKGALIEQWNADKPLACIVVNANANAMLFCQCNRYVMLELKSPALAWAWAVMAWPVADCR